MIVYIYIFFFCLPQDVLVQILAYVRTMIAHAWESGGARSSSSHAWEDEWDDEGAVAPDTDSDSDFEPAAETAGALLVRGMLELLFTRTLNATQFCHQMHRAHAAGIAEAKQYGLAPGAPSGHYQRKLERVLGKYNDDMYELSVPGHDKNTLGRCMHKTLAFAAYEQIAEDMAQPTYHTRLLEVIPDLPRVYHEHPVVQGTNGTVAPFALYIDGLPYTKTDSVIGYWLVDVTTGQRYLFLIYRKKLMCDCGCRGWCSHYAILRYIRWLLEVLAKGSHPSERHDGQPWMSTDRERMLNAGSPIPFIACVPWIKGDWAEYASTLGFPSWQDGIRPCFQCPAFGMDMFESCGHTLASLIWPNNTHGDYEAACVRCELNVLIDRRRQRI